MKDMNLPPLPVLKWKQIPWDKLPSLPWPHKMVNFAGQWSQFYPCKKCGNCCKNPPLVKVEGDKGYYLLRNEKGYCVMYDEEKRECKIYEERPMECRLLVCRAPETVKDRLEQLLVRFLAEYAPEFEKYSDIKEMCESIGEIFKKQETDENGDKDK